MAVGVGVTGADAYRARAEGLQRTLARRATMSARPPADGGRTEVDAVSARPFRSSVE